jgi:hypothetical protein
MLAPWEEMVVTEAQGDEVTMQVACHMGRITVGTAKEEPMATKVAMGVMAEMEEKELITFPSKFTPIILIRMRSFAQRLWGGVAEMAEMAEMAAMVEMGAEVETVGAAATQV